MIRLKLFISSVQAGETRGSSPLFGTYIHKRHGSRYYGKAMNITRQLTAAYDEVLFRDHPPRPRP